MLNVGKQTTGAGDATQQVEAKGGKQRMLKDLAGASFEEQEQKLDPGNQDKGPTPPTNLKQLFEYEGFEELSGQLAGGPVPKPALLGWLKNLFGIGQAPTQAPTQPDKKAEAPTTPAVTVPPAKADAPPPPEVTGLASKVSIGRFVTAAKKVETDWGKLTKEERADGLGDAAGNELKAAGVPETGVVVKDLGTRNGELDFQPWNLNLNQTKFAAATTTKDEMAGMADTVYHESRHAEQWHRMARILAGKGKKADEIATETAIKKEVCDDAAKKPLTGTTQEAKEGQEWYDSVYGAQRAHRNTVLTNLTTHAADYQTKLQDTLAKQATFQGLPPTATQEQKDAAKNAWILAFNAYTTSKATFDATYAQYRALPEEKDAWAVGGDVSTEYKK